MRQASIDEKHRHRNGRESGADLSLTAHICTDLDGSRLVDVNDDEAVAAYLLELFGRQQSMDTGQDQNTGPEETVIRGIIESQTT